MGDPSYVSPWALSVPHRCPTHAAKAAFAAARPGRSFGRTAETSAANAQTAASSRSPTLVDQKLPVFVVRAPARRCSSSRGVSAATTAGSRATASTCCGDALTYPFSAVAVAAGGLECGARAAAAAAGATGAQQPTRGSREDEGDEEDDEEDHGDDAAHAEEEKGEKKNKKRAAAAPATKKRLAAAGGAAAGATAKQKKKKKQKK